jgi:hypothetical protein
MAPQAPVSPFCRPEEDPFLLLHSTQRAIEVMLRRSRGGPLRRSWCAVPYGEEEIARLEEEVLPAIASCLARLDEIDRRVELQQERKARGLAPAQVSCQLPGWAEVAMA